MNRINNTVINVIDEINNLSVGKIKNISFVNQKIIVHSKSGKAVIF